MSISDEDYGGCLPQLFQAHRRRGVGKPAGGCWGDGRDGDLRSPRFLLEQEG